jgi:hypothetical protein
MPRCPKRDGPAQQSQHDTRSLSPACWVVRVRVNQSADYDVALYVDVLLHGSSLAAELKHLKLSTCV